MRDHVTNLRYKVYTRKLRNFAYSFNYLSAVHVLIVHIRVYRLCQKEIFRENETVLEYKAQY